MSTTRYTIKVKPGCRVEKIERLSETELLVWVRAPAQEGKANTALIAALAEYFGVSKSRVNLLKGMAGRRKVVEILR